MTIDREGWQVPIVFVARNISYCGGGGGAGSLVLRTGNETRGREVGQSSQLKKAESGDWKQGYCNGHLSNGEGRLKLVN